MWEIMHAYKYEKCSLFLDRPLINLVASGVHLTATIVVRLFYLI